MDIDNLTIWSNALTIINLSIYYKFITFCLQNLLRLFLSILIIFNSSKFLDRYLSNFTYVILCSIRGGGKRVSRIKRRMEGKVHLPARSSRTNFFFFFYPSCLVIVRNTIIDEFQALIKSDADDFPPLPISIIESFSTRDTRLFLFSLSFFLSSFLLFVLDFSTLSIPLNSIDDARYFRNTTRQRKISEFLEWRCDRSIESMCKTIYSKPEKN